MLWLEMSRDEAHGGSGWAFTECLWSPARKEQGQKWAYWELLQQVNAGDSVLHLRGRDRNAAFVGYSVADTDGYRTELRPPQPGTWAFATSFYRVPLRDFVPFADPIALDDVFAQRNQELRSYYQANRQKSERNLLFFVVQGGRLQCQNGAYLSQVDDELGVLLLGSAFSTAPGVAPIQTASVTTGLQVRQISGRVGQDKWSEAVRANYGSKCCFPGCSIDERRFLVASHIARWSDVEALRGDVANGLCLCLLHDRAFETGLFTLSSAGTVWVNLALTNQSRWAQSNIAPYHGQSIKTGSIVPASQALAYHWERVQCQPGQGTDAS